MSQKRKVFSDINITPLTDIFLVLLLLSSFPAPFFYSPYALSDILFYPALGPEYG